MSERMAQVLVDPALSLWVSAHAGSGKTRVLINRVARLLVAGTPPEKILCLTFTKAAAAEMAERLSARLGALALADDTALRAALREIHVENADDTLLIRTRTLFARAIETPGGLKIETIHAFCQRVLNRFPLEAGVPPHFEVLEDRGAAELLKHAIDDTLADVEQEGDLPERAALAVLARECETTAFQSMMADLRTVSRDPDVELTDSADRVYPALGLDRRTTEEAIQFDFLERLPHDAMRRAATAMGRGSTQDIDRAASIEAFLQELGDARTDAIPGYVRVFLTAKDAPRKDIATKGTLLRTPGLEEDLVAEQQRILRFVEQVRAVRCAALGEAVLRLGEKVLRRYEALKRQRALLDFDDLIVRTLGLLTRTTAAWVLFKLDGGLDHILVDEAQDTNPLQWRIITTLADEFFTGESARAGPRTIFAVGDEKQSIYRFQGADPKIFEHMQTYYEDKLEAAGYRLHTPYLNLTRRSVQPVLDLVDAVCAPPAIAAMLSSIGTPPKHAGARVGQGGIVELWPTEKPDPEQPRDPWNVPLDYVSPASPRARLARKIADVIERWLVSGERLPSEDRPITPGDILILVRRRDAFVEEMIRALKRRRIPVAGTDRLALTAHIAVMDLMALGEFALLPSDDLTLATVLKGPLGAFDEERLFTLAYGREGSLWAALRASAMPGAQKVAAFLEDVRALAKGETPYGLYSRVLGPMGGRARLVGRLGPDAHDPLDEFLRLALAFERQAPPSLQGFLHWLRAGETEVKRDMEPGRGEVRVMTVHGAKGLEANIVILPDTCAMPHRRSRSGFYKLAAGDSLVPVLSARASDAPVQMAAARQDEQAAGEAEHLRLLYVALTRARDRLYIAGYETKNGRDPMSWHALCEAALQEIGRRSIVASGEEGYRLEAAQTETPGLLVGERAPRGEPVPLPLWAHRSARPEPRGFVTVSPSALGGVQAPAPPGPLDGGDAVRTRFQRGRLIHRLFEVLPALARESRAAAAARYLGLPSHALDSAAQAEIATCVLAILEAPAFAPLFGPDGQAEVPVVGFVSLEGGTAPVYGVVDRLIVTPEQVTVIDYKTNRPPPTDLDGVALAYWRQMAAYRAVLKGLYPHRAVTCALLWTEAPALMILPPERLDAVLAQTPLP